MQQECLQKLYAETIGKIQQTLKMKFRRLLTKQELITVVYEV